MIAEMSSKKTTVLEGYYNSGDYECFCFDKLESPGLQYEDPMFQRWLHWDEEVDGPMPVEMEAYDPDHNRVYPEDLMPCQGKRYGKWTITVEFEEMEK